LNIILLFNIMRIHRQMPIVVAQQCPALLKELRRGEQGFSPRRARQQEQQFHFRFQILDFGFYILKSPAVGEWRDKMKEVRVKILLPEYIYQFVIWSLLLYRRLRYGEAFRIIPLTKGLRAIVSPEDYDRLSAFNWCASKCRHTIYAQRTARTTSGPKRQRNVRMHRELLGITDDRFVDHQNHNGLDNRRTNLRITTPAQNGWNRNKTASLCTSRFKGVCWSKKMVKWHAQIKENGKQTTIGFFDDEELAARAYDAKAKELYGQYAALNFPGPAKDPLAKWSNAICYGKFTG